MVWMVPDTIFVFQKIDGRPVFRVELHHLLLLITTWFSVITKHNAAKHCCYHALRVLLLDIIILTQVVQCGRCPHRAIFLFAMSSFTDTIGEADTSLVPDSQPPTC